ncbi:MAG: DUF2851 family protein, partial [Verrucomicrobia bacterium]|nr:DUF2851 family protein [Verrucomicrobiota bacterium]
MNGLWVDDYARWRAAGRSAEALRDGGDSTAPAERLLQQIWHHQRLRRDHLTTLDGHRVRVLHPGFWNREAGPDFRGAILQLDNGPARSGDVEIDRQTGGWHGHRHHQNPDYDQVILHVVWEAAARPDLPLPTLALKPVLDAPIEELVAWLGSLPAE